MWDALHEAGAGVGMEQSAVAPLPTSTHSRSNRGALAPAQHPSLPLPTGRSSTAHRGELGSSSGWGSHSGPPTSLLLPSPGSLGRIRIYSLEDKALP